MTFKILRIDSVALLEHFRALKPTLLEHFRAPKSDRPIGEFQGPKTTTNGAFQGPKTTIIGAFQGPNFYRPIGAFQVPKILHSWRFQGPKMLHSWQFQGPNFQNVQIIFVSLCSGKHVHNLFVIVENKLKTSKSISVVLETLLSNRLIFF